jgi:hypothetical protein
MVSLGLDHGCSRLAPYAIIAPAAVGTVGGTMMDDRGDGAEPVRIMTYRELATALGIDEESAQRRAQRRKWRRMRGNDGKARVAVPLSVVPDAPGDSPPGDAFGNGGTVPQASAGALAPLLLDLAAQVRAAREALDAARAEAVAVRERAAAEVAEVQKHAAAETAEARERAAKAEGEAGVLRSALEDTKAALVRLQRRGLLARLLNWE